MTTLRKFINFTRIFKFNRNRIHSFYALKPKPDFKTLTDNIEVMIKNKIETENDIKGDVSEIPKTA